MIQSLRLPALLILSILAAPVLAGEDSASAVDTSQAFDAHAAFEALKSLEGTWTGTVDNGAGTPRETTVVWDVSAAGHSLIQTFAPGSPHEMFSVYHMDGDELLMTHYCAIGNAPKMKFEPSSTPGQITLAFNGGTNLDPAKDAHAHQGQMQLIDANNYESVSIGFARGEASSEQHFKMTRQD